MYFGKWKEGFYLTAAKSVHRENDRALQWLAEIEAARVCETLSAPAAPFSALDAILHAVFHKKLTGLQLMQYRKLQSTYLAEGRTVRGRQAAFIYFQKYVVDDASKALHQSKLLRSLTLGSSLIHFLNAWTEQVSNMDSQPSEQ